jgi:hypothetical protein
MHGSSQGNQDECDSAQVFFSLNTEARAKDSRSEG